MLKMRITNNVKSLYHKVTKIPNFLDIGYKIVYKILPGYLFFLNSV